MIQKRSSFWTVRLLWIDSICINKKDTDERTTQVRLMGRIYSKVFCNNGGDVNPMGLLEGKSFQERTEQK
jgi:hypothetical protein